MRWNNADDLTNAIEELDTTVHAGAPIAFSVRHCFAMVSDVVDLVWPEIDRLRAERVVADDIIRRLAAMDPRAFNGVEERICACCRGMQTHPDAVHPAGIVVVEHDDSWTGYGGKRHEATESIAHEPDCVWLACRQEDDR